MEIINKPTHGSLEWLQVRHRDSSGRVRFGASEAPILMGVSKYRNVVDLAIEKWADPEVKEQNDAMMRGHILEPALLEYASQLLKCKVETPDEMFSVGRFVATLDGLADDGRTIVEAKTTTFYSSDDPLPVEYYWQVLAQLACRPEADLAVIIVLDKRMRFGHWTVEREYVQADIERLWARADEVGNALDAGVLPEEAVPNEMQIKSLYPSPEGEVELTFEQFQLLSQWQDAKRATKEAEEIEQGFRDEISRLIAGKDTAVFDGEKVLTYKTRKGSVRIDTKRLENDHPDLVQQYKVMGASTRILRSIGDF